MATLKEYKYNSKFLTWANSKNGAWVIGSFMLIGAIGGLLASLENSSMLFSFILYATLASLTLPPVRLFLYAKTNIILNPVYRWTLFFLAMISIAPLQQSEIKKADALAIAEKKAALENQERSALLALTDDFKKQKDQVILDLKNAISQKDISRAESIAKKYDGVQDDDLSRLSEELNKVKSKIHQEEAKKRYQEIEKNITKAIKNSDDFSRHKKKFIDISVRLAVTGKCSYPDFENNNGWLRSTNYPNRRVYFTFCGGDARANRLYFDIDTNEIFTD